ncbi:MAG: hypothetical protein WCS86_03935 [Candidatus Paceibacterota bacterium]
MNTQIPFIKFPVEWEIKFLQGSNEKPIYFCIKKVGAPNIVSVVVFLNKNSEDLFWEIAVLQEFGDGTSSIRGHEAEVSIKEIDLLIRIVEKKFYEEIE